MLISSIFFSLTDWVTNTKLVPNKFKTLLFQLVKNHFGQELYGSLLPRHKYSNN